MASSQILITLDTSRSMFRSDYKPSRFNNALDAIKLLVSKVLEKDATNSFALITFNDSIKKMNDFTRSKDEIFNSLDELTLKGSSSLGEALGLSIKVIINELRKISDQIPRILLISDGNATQSAIDPLKMAKLAAQLNIKIDTFRLGESSHLNILKRLSDISKGKYYFSNDKETLKNSARSYYKSSLSDLTSQKDNVIKNPQYLRKIAASLLRVQDLTKDQEQRLKQIRGVANYKKCSICFSEKDPVTKGSFYLTGRFCPNCNSPFHVHCLAGWADSQNESHLKRSGTVRCPHCYYLLKIPSEVTKAKRLKALTTHNRPRGEEKKEFPAYQTSAEELGIEATYSSCPVCNMIFEKTDEIIKCGNPDCGALYHKNCFKELKGNICRSCGFKLILDSEE
ncbi:MAG: VWA domain-containing protein [Promethearchaeota archaeon]|nr:MAG: VWA domain-containing protein [Candidatus Lokiarchaeota archaeon]